MREPTGLLERSCDECPDLTVVGDVAGHPDSIVGSGGGLDLVGSPPGDDHGCAVARKRPTDRLTETAVSTPDDRGETFESCHDGERGRRHCPNPAVHVALLANAWGSPVLIGSVEVTFLILLVVVILGPAIAERFRIPGIVGLIFGGALFGPFVLNWLPADGLVTALGAIGLLYLMYLAGATFDIQAFNANRRSAVSYGLLGFIIPFTITLLVVGFVFDVGLLAAALMGAMWASNTLVAYPEVQAAGLQKNRAVSAAVSAGVVADLLSLTVLAVVTATAVIELDPLDDTFARVANEFVQGQIEPTTPDPKLPLWLALPLLAAFCLWLLPKVTQRFFVTIGRSRMQRFVFALAGMSAGAAVALLGGVEGLIGAFLAGLGMNRLIPTNGPLMERLEFVGAAIFVPTFLVSIGLNIDPALLVDRDTLLLGLIFTMFVVVGKTAAALVTSRIFRFSFAETGLMSSLSFGQAASTLAIAQVGLSLGMFEQIVVNASVIAIVVTALLTSYGTRYFAGRVPRDTDEIPPIGATVLVDVRDQGSDLDTFVALAGLLTHKDAGLVVPYLVAQEGQLDASSARIGASVDALAGHGYDADGIVRLADSFGSGTLHLAEEQGASMLMLSWSGPRFAADYLLGSDIDDIGRRSPVPTMAVHVVRPWERVVLGLDDVRIPWKREDARLAVDVALRLVPEGTTLLVVADDVEGSAVLFGDDDPVELVEGNTFSVRDLRSADLAVAPGYLLRERLPQAGWRMGRVLDDLNLVAVAGPNRLSISKGVTRRTVSASLPLSPSVVR